MNMLLLIASSIFIFLGILLGTSRYFYLLSLKSFSKHVTKKLHINPLKLYYSFEQMVYFISLPSNLPLLKDIKKENIETKLEYASFIFPSLKGIQIYTKNEKEVTMLAYLPIKDFRLPSLDKLLEEGQITEESYFKISTYKLIHPKTLQEIVDEVYKQIHEGRYGTDS